jgi:hypothetical protein
MGAWGFAAVFPDSAGKVKKHANEYKKNNSRIYKR